MGKGNRFAKTWILGVVFGFLLIPIASLLRAKSPERQSYVAETTQYLKDYRTNRELAPVDCEALYDLIQAAQSVYLEQCPGP